MANEVNINFMRTPSSNSLPVVGFIVGSEVTDIGTRSAAVNADLYKIVRLTSVGVGFWFKVGASDVAATNDSGSTYLPADQSIDIEISAGRNYIDTAAL